ncbi:MAG: amino acid ABC transporter [Chloroflexi bacterium GWB2_49_20]|nr:MAG: amino acid ABC transporter [Chloroflexi bacterium GWB2_49_20]OGN79989.1 MAG: amino acid ABC transporter [Chloroflexi bacterium GWC2_49_37]OGN85475.1 MAG: amino acid ABC transporter [Chloroflexi bacterium GWD2_49_16]HBG74343.1 branched-chain amino acid ABC transporter permease [Anaerolineae bacterium]HCM97047.1 branched-chain amino acid ABC transporter permease [Anaerolineae bacterium]
MLRTWRQRITIADVVVWIIGLSIAFVVVYGSIKTIEVGKYNTRVWIDLTITGLALGGVYALIALGYTIVYGVLKMINFAHSEIFMSGPFTAVFLALALYKNGFWNSHPYISLLLVTLLAVTVSSTLAVLLERIAYRPLRTAPRLVPLITAIGASFFLQYAFRGFFGSGLQAYPELGFLKGTWTFGSIPVYKTQVVVIISALIMMLILYGFVQLTKMGKAMRAVSEDKEVAGLMGIDVDRIIMLTFALGGASAGLGGILYILLFPVVHFFMGFIPGLKAFTAAVLGGIGNVPGAFLGAMILGILEAVGPSLFLDGMGIAAPYQLKDAIAFIILVFILIIRPSGILGERITQTKA